MTRYLCLWAAFLLVLIAATAQSCFAETKSASDVPSAKERQSAEKLSAAEQRAISKFVTIPILYLTDRELKGNTFGSRRRYPAHCQHDMYYGTAFVTIPNVNGKSPSPASDKLGWEFSDKKPVAIAPKEQIPAEDPVAAKSQFLTRLEKSLDKTGENQACVYVHGAADAFEDCTLDAASMAYSMEKPLILYSWPSDPKMRGYFIDASNNEWSQGHFNQFCQDLMEFRLRHPLQATFISHSMGNRLVIRSLSQLYGKGLVSNWELVSPDIDADTCRHYIFGLKEDNSNIRLYVSNKDKMLPLSQMLQGGYYRLGEAANEAVMPKNWNPADKYKLQRIDFTAIDTGFRGHSMPFDLIANIVEHNSPGPGLELVDESSIHPSRFSKLAGRQEDLDAKTRSLQPDFCKQVIRTK